MGLEEAFSLRIPDKAIESMATPRHVIDHLHDQLPHGAESPCLSQRAFHILRRTLQVTLETDCSCLRPGTRLLDILPGKNPDDFWAKTGYLLGAPRWPRVGPRGWFQGSWSPQVTSLREATTYLAAWMPMAIKPVGEGWAWSEVAWIVDQHIRESLGIREYSFDDHFVRDLGVG